MAERPTPNAWITLLLLTHTSPAPLCLLAEGEDLRLAEVRGCERFFRRRGWNSDGGIQGRGREGWREGGGGGEVGKQGGAYMYMQWRKSPLGKAKAGTCSFLPLLNHCASITVPRVPLAVWKARLLACSLARREESSFLLSSFFEDSQTLNPSPHF